MSKANKIVAFLLLNICVFSNVYSKNFCDSAEETEKTQKINGILQVTIADDFTNHKSNTFVSLEETLSHNLIDVHYSIKDKSFIMMNAGKSVELEGYQINDKFCVKSIKTNQEKTEQNSPQAIEGLRRALVLIASRTPGTSVSETLRKDIKKIIDDASPEANSVNNTYLQSSYGRLSFAADVVGPYLVQSSGCSWQNDLAAAKAAAESAGVNLNVYDHFIITYTDSTTVNDVRDACKAGGFGQLFNKDSANFYALSTTIYAHEIGHNLGMLHAYRDPTPNYECNWDTCIEYGDPTDFMGAWASILSQNNSIHRNYLGWLPPEAIQDVTKEGTYFLYPIENDTTVTKLRPSIIRLPRQNAFSNQSYYLSYRIPKGIDTNLPIGKNHLHVHWAEDDLWGAFVTTLSSGQSFSDPTHRVFIKNIRSMTNGSIGMDISFELPITIKLSPRFTTLGLNGQLNFDANETVQISGGTPPYTYSAALNSFDISGTTYIYKASRPGLDTITVTDSKGNTGTAKITVSFMDFGGMYGNSKKGKYNNPVTGTYNCPTGYIKQPIMGSIYDNALTYCYRKHVNGVPADFDFGGIYSYSSTGVRVNPYTGGATCPNGYNSAQVYGESSNSPDYPAYICYKKHDESIREVAPFAGMYAQSSGGGFKNPATSGFSCPSWTQATMMLGTSLPDGRMLDYPFYFCSSF